MKKTVRDDCCEYQSVEFGAPNLEHGKKDSRLYAAMSIQNGVLEGLCCQWCFPSS